MVPYLLSDSIPSLVWSHICSAVASLGLLGTILAFDIVGISLEFSCIVFVVNKCTILCMQHCIDVLKNNNLSTVLK